VFVGDQPGPQQFAAGFPQRVGTHVESSAQALLGIVREPLGIADGDEEQVKRQSTVAATADVAIANQPLINPTELPRYAATPSGVYETF
jgi:hypothetical protein